VILDRVQENKVFSVVGLANTIEIELSADYPAFVNWAYLQISTDAIAGNREYSMELLGAVSTNVRLSMTSGGSQAASSVGWPYVWFNGSAYPGGGGGLFLTGRYYTPMPPSAIIEPGGKLKLYDINNVSGGDGMNIQINYNVTPG